MLEKIMNLHLPLIFMAVLGAVGVIGMLAAHLSYRRLIKKNIGIGINLKEKWLNLWKTRDKLLNRMNRFVWYPALGSTVLLGAALFLSTYLQSPEGLPLRYLYLGAMIPVFLLVLRHGLDFSYKEELIMGTLADYVEQMRTWVEDIPEQERPREAMQEEIVERIADSIRQTAASGSHFSRMLTPEEEEIMREVIREFMN